MASCDRTTLRGRAVVIGQFSWIALRTPAVPSLLCAALVMASLNLLGCEGVAHMT